MLDAVARAGVGSAPEGPARNGSAPDGPARNGSAPDGAVPPRAGATGTAPGGSAPHVPAPARDGGAQRPSAAAPAQESSAPTGAARTSTAGAAAGVGAAVGAAAGAAAGGIAGSAARSANPAAGAPTGLTNPAAGTPTGPTNPAAGTPTGRAQSGAGAPTGFAQPAAARPPASPQAPVRPAAPQPAGTPSVARTSALPAGATPPPAGPAGAQPSLRPAGAPPAADLAPGAVPATRPAGAPGTPESGAGAPAVPQESQRSGARPGAAEQGAPRAATPAAAATTPAGPASRADAPESADAPRSPLDEFGEHESRRRWPRVLLVTGVVVLLLAAGYVGAAYALADRVPRGATVAGVQIGGMPAQDAERELEQALGDTATSPVTVTAGGVVASVDPATSGLEFDAPGTVDALTGLDLRPQRLWQHVVGIEEYAPVTVVDEPALESAVDALTGTLTLAPVDGGVVFADGQPHATEAVEGWSLETGAAAELLRTRWLTDEQPLELPTTQVEPDITQEETDAALTTVAQRVTSAPVAVQVGGKLVELPADVLAASASMVPVESDLQLQLDGAKLSEAILARTTNLLTESADARFEFQGGAPVIVPGTPGTTLDPAALAQAVAAAATGDQRTATVELVQTDPAESTAKLEALGIKEIVSEFSTPLNSEPRRTANIANGAKNITGTLVRPGEIFSLTEALGPITPANGFQAAGVIVNGEHVDGMGGGLSQISTTTFNAAHLAGFEDIEHRPHSEWISRYPEGREATIYTGSLDMRWKNNTPYGALVQGWVEGGRVHVRIWGTKYWTVETSTSGRSNVVSPTTTYSQSPTCVPQSAGNPGFSVTTTRKLFLEGQLKDTDTFTWRYKPQNRVVCGAAPTAPAG